MASNLASQYGIRNSYHSEPRRLKIIHVGAGASGLLTAYKARRILDNFELICYEKNPTVGGTWFENRYPGCACDVPAHIYTYSFEPTPEWSGFYASGPEIQQYFVDFYNKHKLEPYMRFNTKVISAEWIEKEGHWMVKLEKDGKSFVDTCDVLINGSGVVNNWKWPDIPNRESYEGILAHTADWKSGIDWNGKRVAVIGIGSSAVQMAPELAKGSRSLTIFARSPTWIAPQMASDTQQVDPKGTSPGVQGKHYYIDDEKKLFREDPNFFLKYRKGLESKLSKAFPLFLRGTPLNLYARKAMRERMLNGIGSGHEELKAKIIPTWSPGCRRLTPGEGFLETLTLDHVTVIHQGVAKFTQHGLVTEDGQHFEFDLIACATGFQVSYVPPFKITGVDGIVMQEAWTKAPNIYLSITAPRFPNYFVINGPTGNWGQGCVLPSHEVQVEYALQCCKKMQEERILSMEVRQLPTTQINQHLDAWHSSLSVWAEECRSWYKGNKTHGRVYIWPGTVLHLLKTLCTPRFEHYEMRYMDENMWSFLGNGKTKLDVMAEEGTEIDIAPYIRSEDVWWSPDPVKALL